MLLLAVDTSTRLGSVAVLRDGGLLGARVMTTGVPHASGLFTDLQALLEEVRIPITAFDLFAVAAGPGSFTGLRVGLTAAKAWAEAFHRPIVPVSSLEAIAIQAFALPDSVADEPIVAVQDARRGQLFGCIYERAGASGERLKPLGEELLLPASEFLTLAGELLGPRQPVFVSPAAELLQPAVSGSVFERSRIEAVSGVLAPFIGKIGYARALQGEVVDALHLDANYVRRTDAEVKWSDDGAANRAGRISAIQQMRAGEATAVAAVWAASPEASQWSAPDVLQLAEKGSKIWVAFEGSRIVGAAAIRVAGDEAEVLNLGVVPLWRRRGAGRGLMRAAIGDADHAGAARVFLEVRESNVGARAFYQALGFAEVGRRRGYYREPAEDALVLALPVRESQT